MAAYRKDEYKGDGLWTIRIPDALQAAPPPEQMANSAKFPEISGEAMAAVMGQFQTAEELEALLKDFTRPTLPGGTEKKE
jgi:hypothetical protein